MTALLNLVSHPVRWVTARYPRTCSECGVRIQVGERMALYADTFLFGYSATPFTTLRHYDEGCGKLLEDSLTTTEAA